MQADEALAKHGGMTAPHPQVGRQAVAVQSAEVNFTGKPGFEVPETDDTPGQVAKQPGTDPSTLCAELRAAIVDGRGAEISNIRARLVATGPNAVPALSGLLASGIATVEIDAVRLLVQIGGSEALAPALGRVLTVPRDSPAYCLYLSAFADSHSPAVATWLTETLGKVQYAATRHRLLDLLSAMRGPEVVAALEQSALNPADDLHAQDAVGEIAARIDPAETAILAGLLDSQVTSVREAAAYGLANIGSSQSCQVLSGYAADDPVSADALAAVSSSYAQDTLLTLATDSALHPTIRTSAILALTAQSGYRVETVLANASVQEQNTEVAAAFQTALNTINKKRLATQQAATGTTGDKVEECY